MPAIIAWLLLLGLVSQQATSAPLAVKCKDIYAPENLLAWCIVPFDAKKRGPEERAQMLHRLGIHCLAYDWREEHIPTFEAEVEAMQRHHIELTAWWFPNTLDANANAILGVIEKYKITPQLWVTGGGEMLQPGNAHDAHVLTEANRIKPIAEAADKLGCQVALYNHGGWFGEPENQLDVISQLATEGVKNVGIVYNFHHGHAHLPRFGELVRKMKPHLLAVNLNGMVRNGDKTNTTILPLGTGDQELEMLRVLQASGWRGVVGIIDHKQETDSEVTLKENLQGLQWLRSELQRQGSGGAKPSVVATTVAAGAETRAPEPAAFFPDAVPLRPADHPFYEARVNRDRIYDFYAKQALHFGPMTPQPDIVPSFAGLDGGRYGHWGNQNEELWRDTSWNDMDAGGMQSGIIAIGGENVPRGVCVQLGEQRELAACFNTDTLTWEGVWSGGKLLHFDSYRWGMMAALAPEGKMEQKPESQPAAKGSFAYHGFYRHGKRVIFAFAKDGQEWLESAWVEQGKFQRQREMVGGKLAGLTKGGPAQWPEVLETKGHVGTGKPYAVDTLAFPQTPWKSLWHLGGHDFLPNGDAVLCTFEGEVWVVSGIDETLLNLRWRRFASGLSQPLGLKVVEGKINVLGRDQLTRLHDLNNDGEADYYEAFSRAYKTPVGGHDYLTGLETDAQGRYYFASGVLGINRISADGKTAEVLATGLRNPNGLAVGPKGEVIAGAQEGDWTAASWLTELTPGGHYRHGGPRPGPLGDLPPTLFFPRGVENSCGGQVFVNSENFGLPQGSLIHLSWGYGTAFVILRETIDSQVQGAAVPMPVEFLSGAHRGRFRKQDGHLYVACMTGWSTYTTTVGSFQRMRYNSGQVVTAAAFQAHENGIRLEFAEPLEPLASSKSKYFAQQWNYRIGPAYGSDEYSVRWPQQPGHDLLEIRSAHVAADRKSVFLEIPQLQPSHQLHMHADLSQLLSKDFYFTLHKLGPPFTDFAGYQAIAKLTPVQSAAIMLDVEPSPFEQGAEGRAIKIQTAAGLQFAQRELSAKVGERISLTLENSDLTPHNWVLGKPGTFNKISDDADRNLANPKALSQSYVPQLPEVLTHTRLVNPNASTTIHFRLPDEKGDYPYLCTFPGHTKIMRGVLHVE